MHPLHARWSLRRSLLVSFEVDGEFIKYDVLEQALLLSPLRIIFLHARGC